MKKAQKNRLEFGLVRVVTRVIQSLPPNAAVKWGRRLGRFIYYCIPIRKRVVLQNLQCAMPELSQKERVSIARGTFEMFGQNFFEFLRTPVRTSDELKSRIHLHNIHLLQEAHDSGNGTILMSGHFGNWEIMACAIVALGYPLVVIAKKQRNRLVNDMIDAYRRSGGIETVPLGMGVRDFLRALRHNKFVAMLADQEARKDAIFVDFFNIPSATATGPALLAIKTGAHIIFSTCIQRRDGDYDVYFEKIPTDDMDGLSEENIKVITQRHVSKLEEKIRQWPNHWFWMHKRWKKSLSKNS